MKGWILTLATLGTLTSCAHSPKKSTVLRLGFVVDAQYDTTTCVQAREHYQANRFIKAAVLFDRCERRSLDTLHANSLRSIGRGEEAAALRMTQVLDGRARSEAAEAKLWLEIGRDYRSAGALGKAWEAAQMGLAVYPNRGSIQVLLAQIALDLDLPVTAQTHLDQVPRKESARYLVAESRLLLAQGKPKKALKTIMKVDQRASDSPDVQTMRTQLLLDNGLYKLAAADIEGHLYTTKGNNHRVLLARRVSYLMHLGKRQQAKESWLLLQSMDPGAPLYPLAVPVERGANPF